MNQEIKAAIANALYIYNRPVDEFSISVYMNFFKDMPKQRVLAEITNWIRHEKYMFTPAGIIEKIIRSPPNERDCARESAGRIRQAITKFGYMGGNEAKHFIGSAGWRMVERWGGWDYICKNVGVSIDQTQFYAQTRDSLESNLKYSENYLQEERLRIDSDSEQDYLQLIDGESNED